jgi:hypothetical protein
MPIHSSLKVFDDGAVLLRSILWTLSIVSMFCNHNISRDGSMFCNHNVSRKEPSLEMLWLQNIETMDEVQRIDRSNANPYLSTCLGSQWVMISESI